MVISSVISIPSFPWPVYSPRLVVVVFLALDDLLLAEVGPIAALLGEESMRAALPLGGTVLVLVGDGGWMLS